MYVHSLSQSEQKLILKYNSLYLKPLFIKFLQQMKMGLIPRTDITMKSHYIDGGEGEESHVTILGKVL